MVDWLCSEFNAMTFKDSGKLQSDDGNDDGVMSSFFGIKCIMRGKNKELKFVMV